MRPIKVKLYCFYASFLFISVLATSCGSSSFDYRNSVISSDAKKDDDNKDPNQEPKEIISPLSWNGQDFGQTKNLIIYPID